MPLRNCMQYDYSVQNFPPSASPGWGYSQKNDNSLDLSLLPTEILSEGGRAEEQSTASPLLVYFPPVEAIMRRLIHCT